MDVLNPVHIDAIENPLYIECGADFTLVMNTHFIVKAFGNNSYGQVIFYLLQLAIMFLGFS